MARVINLGGDVDGGPSAAPLVGSWALAFGPAGGVGLEFAAIGVSLTLGGDGCRFSTEADRSDPLAVLLAATRLAARTGGVSTGFPGKAALAVGLTAGCGIICALDSSWGASRTI